MSVVTEPPAAPAPALQRPPAPRAPRRRRGGVAARGKRRVVWAAAAATAAAALVLASRPEPRAVELAAVDAGPVETAVEEQGMTRVRDRYTVTAPVSGRVLRITVREGEAVTAGDPLARVVPAAADARTQAQASAQVAAARAGVQAALAREAEARAALAQAERDRTRQEALAAAGAVSEADRERAVLAATLRRREVEAAAAAASAARAELRQAEATLLGLAPGADAPPVIVAAPVAGRVLRVPEASERTVAAGTPLVEIADARRLEVVLEVLSQDAVRTRPGAPVRLSDWGGEGILTGSVRTVEPGGFTKVSALGVEEQRVRVIALLDDAPEALGDGYRVEAAIVTGRTERAVRVPVSALFRRGDGWAVFRVEGGRARLRPVRIGRQGGGYAVVEEGLRDGEQVVAYPASDLEDGERVTGAPR